MRRYKMITLSNPTAGREAEYNDWYQNVHLKDLGLHEPVIYRAGGIDYIYSIESTEQVKPDAVDALYVPDGRRLLLVTCSDWSYFWRQYARRLIVTAQLVRTEPSP